MSYSLLAADGDEQQSALSSGGTETSRIPPGWRAPREALNDNSNLVLLQPRPEARQRCRIALRVQDDGAAHQLGEALQFAGHTVLSSTRDPQQTDWVGLRRFEPHALLIDELDCLADRGEWLSQMRRDPHLGRLPAIAFSMPRVLSPSGHAEVGCLLPQIEALTNFQQKVRHALGPGRDLELELGLLGVGGLLRVVGEHSSWVDLEALGSCGQRLKWSMWQSRLSDGVLETSPRQTVGPGRALEWLLARPDARIRIRFGRPQGSVVGPTVDEVLAGSYRELNSAR